MTVCLCRLLSMCSLVLLCICDAASEECHGDGCLLSGRKLIQVKSSLQTPRSSVKAGGDRRVHQEDHHRHAHRTGLDSAGPTFIEGAGNNWVGTAGTLRNMQWLHFPKAGTSFIATLWNYACGQGKLPLDLNVDPNATAKCGRCYDFALMDRYPKEQYCTPGVLADHFQTQHRSTNAMRMEIEETVAFFRRPSQRLISAHRDGLHANGFNQSRRQVLSVTCGSQDASCFARFPGIAGCMTRMLTGATCAGEALGGVTRDSRVAKAVAAVAKLRFVGLTEEWDESVCLFHRMFGGRLSPMELKNFHHHKALGGVLDASALANFREDTTGYDEAELDGFTDDEDEAVYAAAVARFRELQREYGGEEDPSGSACHAEFHVPGVYLLGGGSVGGLSCAEAGVQCGPVDGMLDCGSCPSMRLRDVSDGTLRDVSCTAAGQCSTPEWNVSSTFTWFRQAH